MIYLDNASTTQVHPDVLNSMIPYLKSEYGNAGSIHSLGVKSKKAIYDSRCLVANLIGASPEQIIFTSSGSEANAMVFNGIEDYLIKNNRMRIIVSKVEHDSVLNAAKKCIKHGFCLSFVDVNSDGTISLEHLESLLSNHDDVGLVSVMYVNNETGAINDIIKIGNICKKYNVLFHTDCVQALGCQRINVNDLQCDFLTLSAHKIHAPKGAGALFARDRSVLTELISGGSNQEYGLRGGTENTAAIVGFGKACSLLIDDGGSWASRISLIKKVFFTSLLSNLEKFGMDDILHINGRLDSKSRVLNLRLRNIDAETLVLMLDTRDVYVSAGAACSGGGSEPSHVLLGMGLTPNEAMDSIRISFSIFNTSQEAVEAAKIIADCVYLLSEEL